jgi:hypothetical protein
VWDGLRSDRSRLASFLQALVARASRLLWRERPAPAAQAGCPRHSGRDARATNFGLRLRRAALPAECGWVN